MRIFEANGVKLVKLNGSEIDALKKVRQLFEDLQELDGNFYITDDDGGIELDEVINAVDGIDFMILEE